MIDLTRLSDKELEAIASGNLASLSNETLQMLSGQPQPRTTDIVSDVRQRAMAAFPGTDVREIGRQLGLTTRAGVTGALALPNIAADALTNLVNLIAGRQVMQPTSQAVSGLLTRMGVPEAQTPTERVVQDVAQAMGGVAAPAALAGKLSPMAAEFFLASPKAQTAAAVGGASAGGVARESDVGPLGQVGAALMGATAPAGATSAQAAGRGIRESVRPLTQAGREVITGNVLRSLARDPELAIKQAEAFTPSVPGYTPTTAQATRDIGLISAETPIRSMAGLGEFEAQASAANQARLKILNQMAKDQDALARAYQKRDEVSAPIREQAFANSVVSPETFQSAITLGVNKTIDNILASPKGKRQTVIDVMEDAKTDIARASTPEELYEIRKDLRAAAQGLLDKSTRKGPTAGAFKAAKPELEQVIRAVDDVIESAAPGYRDYLNKYAQSSRGIERLEAAQEFRGKVLTTTPDPSRVGDYMISQPSFAKAIRAAEKDTNLSKTQLAVLRRVSEDLDSGVLMRAGKVPGSDTFKNISTANLIGAIVGKQMYGEVPAALQKSAFTLNWLYSGTDDQIRELLVGAMLDPKLAASLMKKANVMTVEPLSRELKRRAIAAGYGASFGLTE